MDPPPITACPDDEIPSLDEVLAFERVAEIRYREAISHAYAKRNELCALALRSHVHALGRARELRASLPSTP